MSFDYKSSFVISFLILQLICCANCAPKSRELTTYDQKQTGEYNIQLHLKDFQIIAVVGDDSLGSLSGDYDYNYDYSDFTVKPVTPSTTTAKPQFEHKNASSTTDVVTSQPSTNPTSANNEITTKKAQEVSISTVNPIDVSTAAPDTLLSNNTKNQQNRKDEIATDFIHILENPSQIPVIVQDLSQHTSGISSIYKNAYVDKKYEAVTNVAIVPSDDTSGASTVEQELPTLGEIMHYRRCAQGFFKDKRGRCRKIRRPPQIPLGISRFASNLAARFRQAPGSDSETQESESLIK